MKAAYLRVVTETYKDGIELQIDIDRTDVGVIEDKVMAFIRAHNTGLVGMNVGNVNVGQAGSGAGSARGTSPGRAATCDASEFHEAQHDQDQDEHGGQYVLGFQYKGKGKGKSKGGFKGTCYWCGKPGHSHIFCTEKQNYEGNQMGYSHKG